MIAFENALISRHGFADILQNKNSGEKSLHVTKCFYKGELISVFSSTVVLEKPNYLTVQIDELKHIILDPVFLQYINHSCDPNVFFDTAKMELIALKEIRSGDELLFFYPSTEWDMDQPFDCFCGAAQCLQWIKGAAHLMEAQATKYKFTEFIKNKLQKRSVFHSGAAC
jgi:hypothetical protein